MEEIDANDGWTSPRLSVPFVPDAGTLRLIGPDGAPFLTYIEVARQRDEVVRQRDTERARADRLAARLREFGIEDEPD